MLPGPTPAALATSAIRRRSGPTRATSRAAEHAPDMEGPVMTDLLFVNASPRREASESLRIANALIAAYRGATPDAAVDRLDLFDEPLPAFGHDAATAKMTVIAGSEPTGPQALAWEHAQATFERMSSART